MEAAGREPRIREESASLESERSVVEVVVNHIYDFRWDLQGVFVRVLVTRLAEVHVHDGLG